MAGTDKQYSGTRMENEKIVDKFMALTRTTCPDTNCHVYTFKLEWVIIALNVNNLGVIKCKSIVANISVCYHFSHYL